jgi:hypothetical protein
MTWGKRLDDVLSTLVLVIASCATHPASPIVPNSDPHAIGTDAPVRVVAVAPGGEWVVIEQAREDTNADGRLSFQCHSFDPRSGDEQVAYLVYGAGPGAPFSEFISSDRSGGWLVVLNREELVLVNARTHEWTELKRGEIAADEPCSERPARAAQFDAEGKTLLYLRETKHESTAILRTLATGQERDILLGPGKLWRADLSPNGEVVTAYVLRGALAEDPHPGPNPPDDALSGRALGVRHGFI